MSTTSRPTVYLVDGDKGTRDALRPILKAANLPLVSHASAEEFLEALPENPAGCLLVDETLPGMSGLELMAELSKRHLAIPVIMFTGRGDVPLAVEAIRRGAVDVVEKPFKDKLLVEQLKQAMKLSQKWRDVQAERHLIAERMAKLTRRELEVMEKLASGMKNKAIADELGISPKTLDIHRLKVKAKMEARTVADLARWTFLSNPSLLPTTTVGNGAAGPRKAKRS